MRGGRCSDYNEQIFTQSTSGYNTSKGDYKYTRRYKIEDVDLLMFQFVSSKW